MKLIDSFSHMVVLSIFISHCFTHTFSSANLHLPDMCEELTTLTEQQCSKTRHIAEATTMNITSDTPERTIKGRPVRSTDSYTINMGVLLPLRGYRAVGHSTAGAVMLGIEYLRTAPVLQELRDSGVSFTFKWRDTACDDSMGLSALVEMWGEGRDDDDSHIDVFIGESCREKRER